MNNIEIWECANDLCQFPARMLKKSAVSAMPCCAECESPLTLVVYAPQASIEAARRDALEQAAEVCLDGARSTGIGVHAVRMLNKAADRIRALLSQPAPATPPLCPVCGQPMQKGNTWLCIAHGTTLDAGQDSDVIGVRE